MRTPRALFISLVLLLALASPARGGFQLVAIPDPPSVRLVAVADLVAIPDLPPATIAGLASWYCNADPSRGPVSRCTVDHPSGAFAAIRRDLLDWRGAIVTVCAGECVRVQIIDCNCGPAANLIDLYADAFAALAPLSLGRIRVVVTPP